jgi:hypothetical protein
MDVSETLNETKNVELLRTQRSISSFAWEGHLQGYCNLQMQCNAMHSTPVLFLIDGSHFKVCHDTMLESLIPAFTHTALVTNIHDDIHLLSSTIVLI